jgi:competence protein ComEA
VAIGRPLRAGELIDLDRAGAAEIARLPRIGLSLARTIVADRDQRGPFGSLDGLDRVAGVGPGLLAAVAPHVRFSGSPAADLLGPVAVGAPPASSTPPALDLNAATAADLERLPFLGGYMAQQIVAFRDRHGPFPAVDSLVRVPGVGPVTLARVRDRLVVH